MAQNSSYTPELDALLHQSCDDFSTWHATAQFETCFEPRVIVGDVQ